MGKKFQKKGPTKRIPKNKSNKVYRGHNNRIDVWRILREIDRPPSARRGNHIPSGENSKLIFTNITLLFWCDLGQGTELCSVVCQHVAEDGDYYNFPRYPLSDISNDDAIEKRRVEVMSYLAEDFGFEIERFLFAEAKKTVSATYIDGLAFVKGLVEKERIPKFFTNDGKTKANEVFSREETLICLSIVDLASSVSYVSLAVLLKALHYLVHVHGDQKYINAAKKALIIAQSRMT